ncbi:MAG: site-2 protease family protein [Candidatus Scalindua sp.]|nr:site-2 protease family protein [Candidatus Scalindua sp.]
MNEELSKRGPFKSILYFPLFFDIPLINIFLFVVTIFSTYYINGLSYAVSIIIILLAHEMGHFIMCRKYHVDATWPYFIPFPSLFGTLGAVIRMKGHIPDKRALFDIGVAGPIGGLIFAIPVTIIGLSLSEVHPVPQTATGYIGLGEPILFSFFSKMLIGEVSPGYDIYLSPVAFAGWAGLFITALNLLPLGQLDGGHVIYAMLGEHSTKVYKTGILLFCLFTIYLIVRYHNPVWFVFAIMLLFIGFKHPPPIDPYTQLDFKRKCIGVLMLVIFLLSFTPIPLKF